MDTKKETVNILTQFKADMIQLLGSTPTKQPVAKSMDKKRAMSISSGSDESSSETEEVPSLKYISANENIVRTWHNNIGKNPEGMPIKELMLILTHIVVGKKSWQDICTAYTLKLTVLGENLARKIRYDTEDGMSIKQLCKSKPTHEH